MEESNRLKGLPPYVFTVINELKIQARHRGEDIIDLGMGNPDQPTPGFIVDKLIEAVQNSRNHRYSVSRGIYKLREAIANWYKRHFEVDIDPDTEAIAVIGAKEGITQIALSVLNPGDVVLVPSPTYPIHSFGVVIAGGQLVRIPINPIESFFDALQEAYQDTWPRAKMMILSFPHNPTTTTVELDFFEQVVDFAQSEGIIVIHDFAYADIVFDGYRAPSLLQVPGAKEVGVEVFSLSKSYNMAGWRVGFAVGNQEIISALATLKSYMDYGIFQPIQIASIIALNSDGESVEQVRQVYQRRRDVLVSGLCRIGWEVTSPRGTMYVWAKIPSGFQEMGSLGFSHLLLEEGKVVVAPGIGFGPHGEGYVRFALVENEHRIRQAIRGIRRCLRRETTRVR